MHTTALDIVASFAIWLTKLKFCTYVTNQWDRRI